MPALFIFLFKVNIALVLFCLGYYLVLRHLTFYTLNRIYLVTAILFSTLYPKINLSDFVQRHQHLTEPVQTAILNWKAPAENFVKPLYQPNYWQWVELAFWAGVILFATRLLMQLFSLYKLYRQSKPGELNDYPVRLIRDDISPFSFWRSIYINPAKLSPADLKNVLEHEQVHVSEWHTLDILLAELSTIFYWFNPGVWLMKKAVRENIEFITDRKILQKGTDTRQYQYSLLSVSLAATSNTIVNHFNISTIKKRIIMMNAKKSSGYNLTRYVFLVPAVVALLLVFSFSKAEVAKTSLSTFKSIATAVSNIKLIDKAFISPVKAITVKPAVIKLTAKKSDTVYYGKGKTKDGHNKFFMMTTDKRADSINYVIDGTKATKADMKAIDPSHIESLELVPADKAKAFFPELDNNHEVLFVTTNDSDAGKKLKEKMDKTFGGGVLAGRKTYSITSMNKSPDDAAGSGGITVITDDKAPTAVATNESPDDAPVVLNSSGNGVSTSVVVLTDPKASAKSGLTIKKNLSLTIDKQGEVIVMGRDFDTLKNKSLLKTKVFAFNESNPKAIRITGINRGELTLDNTDPLIIIDGKESKGLKKISPDDIKSITILKDESATKLYGDKAKNGVLIITTKKGK